MIAPATAGPMVPPKSLKTVFNEVAIPMYCLSTENTRMFIKETLSRAAAKLASDANPMIIGNPEFPTISDSIGKRVSTLPSQKLVRVLAP